MDLRVSGRVCIASCISVSQLHLPLSSVLGQPLAMLNAEAVSEHHSSPATLQSLAGSPTVPSEKDFVESHVSGIKSNRLSYPAFGRFSLAVAGASTNS